MNGARLALGTVAALAGLAALSRRGSRSSMEVSLVPMDVLWDRAESADNPGGPACATSWSSTLTPQDLVEERGEAIYHEILREEAAEGDGGTFYSEAARYDLDSFEHWRAQLFPFVDREGAIPSAWAIEAFLGDVESDEAPYFIADGFHRLAAARSLGLASLPVRIVDER